MPICCWEEFQPRRSSAGKCASISIRRDGSSNRTWQDRLASVSTSLCRRGHVANANMLKMLRIVSLEKGYDPADFSMVVFGGNGPVHGTELAEELGVNEVLVPLAPGLLSAQGLLVADVRYDFRQTHLLPLYTGKLADLEQIFASLEAKGRAALETHGIAKEAMQIRRSAEMRYLHQAYEVTVELPAGSLSEASRAGLAEAFHSAHERRYGRRQEGAQDRDRDGIGCCCKPGGTAEFRGAQARRPAGPEAGADEDRLL